MIGVIETKIGISLSVGEARDLTDEVKADAAALWAMRALRALSSEATS